MKSVQRDGGRALLEVSIRSKLYTAADGSELAAVRDLAFSIETGRFVCLVGPSGCGKTTILRAILGLDPDFDGKIKLPGSEGRVAAVFQEPRLLPWRTVEQNVRLALGDGGSEGGEAGLDELFATLGLSDMRGFFPGELSLGLARRAALARAFAVEPSLILLDEPFVSLDEQTAGRLRALLMKVWRARSTTALMVTHNLREALELADEIILLTDRPAKVRDIIKLEEPRETRSAHWIADELEKISAAHPGVS
jgi:NitT/TauT family transport system ATP-binding protein